MTVPRSFEMVVMLPGKLLSSASNLSKDIGPLISERFMQARWALHGAEIWLQGFMGANWLAFGVGQTIVAASGVLPASVVAMMAGATLGFVRGVALSSVATLLGGWIAFSLSRSALRGWISRRIHQHPAIARLDAAISNEGWRMVMLLRISPVTPFALASYGMGLTRISLRDFLIGTLASLPALIGYVALGALGQQGLLLAGNGPGAGGRLLALSVGAAMIFYALYRVRKGMAAVPLEP